MNPTPASDADTASMRYPRPIVGAAVWYGAQLSKRDDWIWQLSATEITELERATELFLATGLALESVSTANFPLPQLAAKLSQTLHELQHGRGFVMIRGLPVRNYELKFSAALYLGLGRHFGSLRSSNGKGHLLGHVKDIGMNIEEATTRFYQTNRRLEYHTDSADVVGLLCLQTAMRGGESYIVSSTTLYNEIVKRRPDLIPALFTPYPTDRRGEVPVGMLPWFEIPIFNWYRGHLSAIYLRHYIEEAQRLFPQAPRLTPDQYAAMDLIDELVNDPALHLQMAFEQGDMQFLHNHTIFHSRNDFENWPDAARHRHLLRLWMAPDSARPLPDVYAPRYGSVTPGDRGGIIVPGTRLTVALNAR